MTIKTASHQYQFIAAQAIEKRMSLYSRFFFMFIAAQAIEKLRRGRPGPLLRFIAAQAIEKFVGSSQHL